MFYMQRVWSLLSSPERSVYKGHQDLDAYKSSLDDIRNVRIDPVQRVRMLIGYGGYVHLLAGLFFHQLSCWS